MWCLPTHCLHNLEWRDGFSFIPPQIRPWEALRMQASPGRGRPAGLGLCMFAYLDTVLQKAGGCLNWSKCLGCGLWILAYLLQMSKQCQERVTSLFAIFQVWHYCDKHGWEDSTKFQIFIIILNEGSMHKLWISKCSTFYARFTRYKQPFNVLKTHMNETIAALWRFIFPHV